MNRLHSAAGDLPHVAAAAFAPRVQDVDFHAAMPVGDEYDLAAVRRPGCLVVHQVGKLRNSLEWEVFPGRGD